VLIAGVVAVTNSGPVGPTLPAVPTVSLLVVDRFIVEALKRYTFGFLYLRLSEPDSWSIFYARRYVRKLGIRYLTSANRLTPRLDSTSSVDRTRRVISLDRRGLRDYSCSTVPNARIEQFGRIADSASPTLVTKGAERLSNDYRSPARGPQARSRVVVRKGEDLLSSPKMLRAFRTTLLPVRCSEALASARASPRSNGSRDQDPLLRSLTRTRR
jgi:hypothetical protein